jgi:hypothetical protein
MRPSTRSLTRLLAKVPAKATLSLRQKILKAIGVRLIAMIEPVLEPSEVHRQAVSADVVERADDTAL